MLTRKSLCEIFSPNFYHMYKTVEVRWFFKGNIPPQVMSAYINKGNEPTIHPPRVDHYLLLPDRDDLGIKIRERALEIKHRTNTYGMVQFNSQTAGYVDGWQKWRFDLSPSSPTFAHNIGSSNRWLAIRKQRWLRTYSLTNPDDLHEVSDKMEIENGCEWELSKIQIQENDDSWWSIAFEAFGNSGFLREALFQVVENALINIGNVDYQAASSKSYPAWLSLIHTDGNI